MSTTAYPGPLSIEGLKPPMLGPVPYIGGQPALGVPENPDFAPSLSWMGFGVRDPRYLQRIGAGANVAGGYPNQDVGWMFGAGPGIYAIDQIPSTAAAANIATGATTVGGSMTLQGASTGITVLSAPLTILPTGNVVPKGALVLDGNPAWVGGGTSGAFAFLNPATSLSRAVVVAGTGANVTIHAADVYGNPVTITQATPGTSLKAIKFIISVVGNAIAAAVTVGTADVFGLPLYASEWNGMFVYFAAPPAALITAAPTFVAGVTTAATALTGDVRGTIAPSASDGAKKLTVFQKLDFGVIGSTYAASLAALVGVPQF